MLKWLLRWPKSNQANQIIIFSGNCIITTSKYLTPANSIKASQWSYVPFYVHFSVIITTCICYNIITLLLLTSLRVQCLLMSVDWNEVFELCHRLGWDLWLCQFGLMVGVYAKNWPVLVLHAKRYRLFDCMFLRQIHLFLEFIGLFLFLHMIKFVYQIRVKSLSVIKLQWWWWRSVNIWDHILPLA